MDLFLFNPRTDEILYEEGQIILFNHDVCEVRCQATLSEIAVFSGLKVAHYQHEGKPVFSVNNWTPGYWHPDTDLMHEYMKNHLEDCTLWIDHEAKYPCRHLIEEAEALGIPWVTWDSDLRDKTKELKKQIAAI